MIISRTPFRISFAGGGTDLESFYSKEPGKVLNTTIDKYIYVVVKRQLGIVEYKYRINWSKVEFKNKREDIDHPIVREALILLDIDFPIEISTFADVPAGTGLGSSSSFTVGLLHALYALKGENVTKGRLASEAGKIEVDILRRNIGKQDHFAAAYGDLNSWVFNKDGTIEGQPVFYRREVRKAISDNLILFYTGQKRDANEVLTDQSERTIEKFQVLKKMKDQVPKFEEILSKGVNLSDFGTLLDEGWRLKRSISPMISSPVIDGYYEKAMQSGAIGGKILGAGGGGFLLFYVEPQNQETVEKNLPDLFKLKFTFDDAGTRITYYDQTLI